MAKESLKQRLAAVKDRSTLRLTTSGRKTSKQHTVTVWFLVDGETVYLATLKLKRDWPRNVMKNGHVELNVADEVLKGRARQITDAKRLEHVKALLAKKYWAAWLGSWFGMGPEGAFAVTIDG
jgi:deazaflavin-dependent oxidoreductase (nitroreductase family)